MAEKMKFAFLLTGGCAGCEMALIDMADKLVDALEHLEVVFWAPTVADIKYKDLEAMPDNSIDLAFIDGMVRLEEHEHLIKVLRQKSNILVAFGICAALGGIPGMANIHPTEEIFEKVYKQTFSTDNPEGIFPETKYILDGKYELTLPGFLDKVKSVEDVVEVDYKVGGCPPHHEFIANIVDAIVSNNLPPKGSWIGSGKAVCEVCDRNPNLKGRERKQVQDVKRTFEGTPEEGECLLEQGYLCFGPFTDGACGASCPKVGIPCRGCGGPLPEVKDFGAQAMSAFGSVLSDSALDQLISKFPNLVKFFYRYSFPGSLLGKTKQD